MKPRSNIHDEKSPAIAARPSQAKAKLAASELRYRRLFESARDGILILDAETGMVVDVNPFLIELLGFTREAFLGKAIWELGFFRDIVANQENFATLQKTAYIRYADKPLKAADGRRIDVEFVSNVYLVNNKEVIQCNIREITERKQAEAKLLASEQEFRAMFEVASIGMAQADPYTQYWLRVNAKMCAITGYSAEEMLTMRISELTHPEERQQDLELFQRLVRGEASDYQLEKRYLRKDGTVAWVNVNMTVIRDAGSLPVRAMATIEDITERKRQEAEQQNIDKLQSIGTLAGGIAHDFNNILHGLFGNISLAMDDLPKEHPSYARLEHAEKSMNRAVRLTKQLLTFAKGGDPVKESFSLGGMVEEIARFDLTGSNVRLVCHQAENLWPVDADRGQFQQVISNLVINARQAMPTGGQVHITLENATLAAEAVYLLKPGRYVKVIVRDEGMGIAPTVLPHIFEPYFTTKQTGHGLGLATVWSISAKHDGHIGVASELGNGTIFTLYLPASALINDIGQVYAIATTERAPAKEASL